MREELSLRQLMGRRWLLQLFNYQLRISQLRIFFKRITISNTYKNIVLLEPFYSGSHQQWAEGLRAHSSHNIEILSLPGRHWKWRMHGGAVSLAKKFNELSKKPDLLLATSMLDLTTFLALTREKSEGIPSAIYFHENQLTYPWSPQDRDVKNKRDTHYSFINYVSALAADRVLFNSSYHRDSFLEALPGFLNAFPDRRGKENVELIREKSQVLPLGMDLSRFDAFEEASENEVPLILWNHRWEYDKRPKPFFEALITLKEKGIPFRLVVLGERNEMIPKSFEEAKSKFADEIVHWGYTEDFETYARWLWRADILPVTSKQDFFGGSVVEAMYCNCYPLLPNRLAYPGHVPEDIQNTFLYDGALAPKLEKVVRHWGSSKKVNTKSFVDRYDWGRIIGEYDERLSL